MSRQYGVTTCDRCGETINCDEAFDMDESGYETLCNECCYELDDTDQLDFMEMFGNYEQRKIMRYEARDSKGKLTLAVDTAEVNDSAQPYETAVSHPDYRKGEWIIVQLYDTREEAEVGHQKWAALMTAETLPETLRDVSSSTISSLRDSTQTKDRRTYAREGKLAKI